MSTCLIERDGQVGIIRLNRPEKFNSFNREMALALQDALLELGNDANIRAVLLTSDGKAFCAGQDLSEAINPDGPGIQRIVREHYNPIIERMRSLQKPVLVAVNGVAAGAGANIALAGDIVVAGASASFIQAFSKIGLVPDSGGTFFLPRLIGLQRSMALMMLGDKVSAADAQAMGMIYKVFPDETLASDALQLAKTLAQMPTKGLWLTKQLLNQSFSNDLTAQLAQEEVLQAQAGTSGDYREGVAAFLEKRKPNFTGQ